MQNLPIEFSVTDVVVNPTFHLSYNFDMISSFDIVNTSYIDIEQSFPIQALQLNLAGRTSNPNISVSMDAVTRLFTLNTVYITDVYPHMKEDNPSKCFVIEGFSIENVNKEKVLIFLPMNSSTTTNNLFYPIETAIVNNSVHELNLNNFIPSLDISTDYYSYYKHTDDSGCLFHVVFFSKSSLGYSDALTIPTNSTGYSSEEVVVVNKANILALHHTNMNNQYEDNIYIDCVPVDILNKPEETYMQVNESHATYYMDMLIILAYMIALTFVVYGIYYFYIYITAPSGSAPVTDIKT